MSNHFLVVSPSTREGSTLDHARQHITGPDMQRLEAATPGGITGFGFWKDGAEESRIVPVADAAHLRRRMATLGRIHDQKGVIGFERGGGPDAFHLVVVPDADPGRVHAGLLHHGVEYATVLPGTGRRGRHSLAIVLDRGGGLAPNVHKYAASVGGKFRSEPGTVHYIGADTREEAHREYEKELLGG